MPPEYPRLEEQEVVRQFAVRLLESGAQVERDLQEFQLQQQELDVAEERTERLLEQEVCV